MDTSLIVKTKDFDKPIQQLKNGSYKMKSGIVYPCFSTDFLIEEADLWCNDCWGMIKEKIVFFYSLQNELKDLWNVSPMIGIVDTIMLLYAVRLRTKDLRSQARKANIDYKAVK